MRPRENRWSKANAGRTGHLNRTTMLDFADVTKCLTSQNDVHDWPTI